MYFAIDSRHFKYRTQYVYIDHNRRTRVRKSRPPHGIKLTKGPVHIIASREYVEYVIISEIAQDFLAWVEDTSIPDETFFTSLNYNPQLGVPGSFTGWSIIVPGYLPGHHGPFVRYVNVRFAHAPRMPGTFSSPQRVSDTDMHHGTCVTDVP